MGMSGILLNSDLYLAKNFGIYRKTKMIKRHYYSVQERIINGKGQRNIVNIQNNGPAVKIVEQLGSQGHVLKRKTRKLTQKEKVHILKGTFVPMLWKNCTLKNKKCRKN